MDESVLRRLLAMAVLAGICDTEILAAMDDRLAIVTGPFEQSTCCTYIRRLRRTESGSDLRHRTEQLVELLAKYPEEFLNKVTVYPERGGSKMFLADESESRILLWMRMFDHLPPSDESGLA
ncbi:hypothetical protein [Nocardia sp. bgisy134]|uniref:hypothetical protein n=1 Tax=Nocardia sp. bgisy134 TaxID=3413789 RepID=UPI003D75F546